MNMISTLFLILIRLLDCNAEKDPLSKLAKIKKFFSLNWKNNKSYDKEIKRKMYDRYQEDLETSNENKILYPSSTEELIKFMNN